jgi:putative oxidoreductase
MKKLIFIALLISSSLGCVQKAYEQTVVFTLDVSKIDEPIQTVGIRGNGAPLSWDADYPMTPIYPDSLYTATFKVSTGYKFAEVKFVVNGQFELEGQPNRRVVFNESNTTNYNAIFNTQQ